MKLLAVKLNDEVQSLVQSETSSVLSLELLEYDESQSIIGKLQYIIISNYNHYYILY